MVALCSISSISMRRKRGENNVGRTRVLPILEAELGAEKRGEKIEEEEFHESLPESLDELVNTCTDVVMNCNKLSYFDMPK